MGHQTRGGPPAKRRQKSTSIALPCATAKSTTLAAILVGLIIINAVSPGIVDGEPARDILALEADSSDISSKVEGRGVSDVAEVFKRMIPANIVKAAAEGQMLGMIFFSILFGYFMTHLDNEYAEPLYRFGR